MTDDDRERMVGDDGRWVQFDVHDLAERGAPDAGPCALCGKRTRSHVLADVDGTIHRLDARDVNVDELLDGLGGAEIGFDVICHNCFDDVDVPLAGKERAAFIERGDEFPALSAVVG